MNITKTIGVHEQFRNRVRLMLDLPPERRPVSAVDEMIYEGREAALAALDSALHQVNAGRGFDPSSRLEGIGIEGFYVLVRSCGFEVVGQAVTPMGDALLDHMRIRAEREPADELVIYNLVVPSRAPLESEADR